MYITTIACIHVVSGWGKERCVLQCGWSQDNDDLCHPVYIFQLSKKHIHNHNKYVTAIVLHCVCIVHSVKSILECLCMNCSVINIDVSTPFAFQIVAYYEWAWESYPGNAMFLFEFESLGEGDCCICYNMECSFELRFLMKYNIILMPQ